MTERLYLERPDVYMLADYDDRDGGRARLVVCEHPDGAQYAARLAASLGLPLRYGPEAAELAGAPAGQRQGRPAVALPAVAITASGRSHGVEPGRHQVRR